MACLLRPNGRACGMRCHPAAIRLLQGVSSSAGVHPAGYATVFCLGFVPNLVHPSAVAYLRSSSRRSLSLLFELRLFEAVIGPSLRRDVCVHRHSPTNYLAALESLAVLRILIVLCQRRWRLAAYLRLVPAPPGALLPPPAGLT